MSNLKLKAETAYIKHVITKIHPTGLVSLVCDSYDFWGVIGYSLPKLKQDIMNRKGGPVGDKVVIRPDSGDPVKIVCGDPDAPFGSLEYKGAIEALWDIFGGTVNSKGYKVLDSHIGLIYGDAITLKRCQEMCDRLKEKGFASTNIVLGIGSYSYQYNTRDTFGYALKSTYCVINGDEKMIFKNPKTDDGTKKSQKGKVAVLKTTNSYTVVDGLNNNINISGNDELRTIFKDGVLTIDETWSNIKKRLIES